MPAVLCDGIGSDYFWEQVPKSTHSVDSLMGQKILDVIFVGGGPAGCAAALSLHKLDPAASFILLDDANSSSFKVGESLPPESSRILQYLHQKLPRRLSGDVSSGKHLPCSGHASAWASLSIEERHAILNPFGHGLHLDRAAFDDLLRQTVSQCVQSESPGHVTEPLVKGSFKGVEKGSEGDWLVHATVEGKSVDFRAKWIVDATGRKAAVATKLGAKTIITDPLLAFYAILTAPSTSVADEMDQDHRTLIEATSDGWFYTALLSQNPPTRIIAFHTKPSHPSAKRARRQDGFLELLLSTSVHISAIVTKHDYRISDNSYPRCTAAGSSHLEPPCELKQHWMAVGDAVMAFDPLSSQGMMTALEIGCLSGAEISRLIGETHSESTVGWGDLLGRVRAEYEKHRSYYYGVVKRFEGEEFWDAAHA